MEEKVLEILKETFELDSVDKTCSQTTCEAWDSMGQLNLVAELEDAFDNIGLFVNNIKLKAIDFPKKYQKKLNDYLVRSNTTIKPSIVYGNQRVVNTANSSTCQSGQFVSVNNTMQTRDFYPNLRDFKVCGRCGFKNSSNSNNCNNRGNKLYQLLTKNNFL